MEVDQLLNAGSRQFERLFEVEARKSGLQVTAQQYYTLEAIERCNSDNFWPSQRRLSEETLIDKSTMSDLLGRLRTRGIIKWCMSERDKRTAAILLTEDGRDLVERARPIATKARATLLMNLPQEIQDRLVETLTIMLGDRRVLLSD